MRSKELEAFNRITLHTEYDNDSSYDCLNFEDDYKVVEQALLKAQEQEKVIKIIFKKKIDMWHLVDLLDQTYEMYIAFCKSEKYEEDYILTEEEFDLLEAFFDERQ